MTFRSHFTPRNRENPPCHESGQDLKGEFLSTAFPPSLGGVAGVWELQEGGTGTGGGLKCPLDRGIFSEEANSRGRMSHSREKSAEFYIGTYSRVFDPFLG